MGVEITKRGWSAMKTTAQCHAYSRGQLLQRISLLEKDAARCDRARSAARYQAASDEALQCDAVLKIMEGRMVGIDALHNLSPVACPRLLATLLLVASKHTGDDKNLRDLLTIITNGSVALSERVGKGGAKPTGRIAKSPRVFIVHGHDKNAVLAVGDYVQNTLGLGRPIILRRERSSGSTIIEKFEEIADNIDIAVVLLTPDDLCRPKATRRTTLKPRARQNVVFEMGYFMARLRRRSGRVLALHKGNVELPSDISGVIYIDITKGIDKASDEIRNELKGLGLSI